MLVRCNSRCGRIPARKVSKLVLYSAVDTRRWMLHIPEVETNNVIVMMLEPRMGSVTISARWAHPPTMPGSEKPAP
ncbi:hypothetical protein JMJ77_0004020 [Colletotrichum scovillei]|uniref:Uncharacterized protein n=1 Tax=Colletotrichum scovillei TaxID=1209932 RepID=A0A9P7QWM4_9PEZI|nr:hypothetical protein JMJ77_0004020 [Colletotrichum scovillei]KAG7049270.1 hypothetical protein JMJ78_0013253 [Colletotrichum scovillei]KAG7064012.1 hypothetical protein JMJ76_0007060 [Colletotrichum scovillei]